MAQQRTPKAVARGSRSNQRDFLKELEERARLNRGGFSTFADDTGYTPGYILPDAMSVQQGLGLPQIAGQSAQFSQAPLPQYPEIPQFEQPQLDLGGDGASGDGSSVDMGSFFDALTQSALQAYGSVQDQQEQLFQTQGIDYPIQSMADGSVRMRSGAIRQFYEPPQPVGTQADGSILFSDGTTRIPGVHFNPGLEGLQDFLGLSGQAITQDFGNYNPGLEPGSGYNMGTDIRTRDLAQKAIYLPVGATVMQVFQDDGTRFGDVSGHQGYGNSVLLQLPTGEMIRLSHFDIMGNFEVGQTVQPGTFIGIPGTSGNTAGEHLDVEYYNQQGQIDNPINFSGFYDPQALTQPQMSQDIQQPQQQPQQPTTQGTQIQQQQQIDTPVLNAMRSARESGGDILGALEQVPSMAQNLVNPFGSPAGAAVAADIARGTIDAISPTGNFDPGITEGIITPQAAQARRQSVLDTAQQQEPFRQGVFGDIRQRLGNFTEAVGDRLGIPEGYASEFIAGAPTQRTNQAFASEFERRMNPNQSFERSEQVKQGSPLYQGVKRTVENLGEAASDIRDAIPQAGEGIRRLFSRSGGTGVNLFSRRRGEDLSPQRAVGATGSSGNQLGSAPLMSTAQASRVSDTTDPFFKSQLFEKMRGFTNFEGGEPGRDQALSIDVFGEDFYNDPSRVQSVFGETFMEDPALQKATQQVKEQFRQRYSGDEYDQADVDRILSQLPDTLTYTPNLPEPKKARRGRPTLQSYLDRGKTVEQYYAETGQQSTADSLRKSGVNIEDYARGQDRVRSGGAVFTSPGGVPVRGTVDPRTGGVSVGGQSLRSGEQIGGMSVAPHVVARSGRSSSNQSREPERKSMFSRAVSGASNLFKRFFN